MTDHTPCPACSAPAAPVSHSPARVQRHTAALAAARAHVGAGGALVGMVCDAMARPATCWVCGRVVTSGRTWAEGAQLLGACDRCRRDC